MKVWQHQSEIRWLTFRKGRVGTRFFDHLMVFVPSFRSKFCSIGIDFLA